MWMYDLTGGARIGKLHKRLKKGEAVAHMPTLPEERLAGGYLYYDAAADDARLTLTLARTAALDHGAVVANHAGVVELLHEDGRAGRGAVVDADGQRIEVRGPMPSSTPPACGPTTCGPSTRAATRTASARPRASTSPCRGRRCATTSPSSCRCRRTSAPCSSCRGSRPTTAAFQLTYIGTTDTDYDGPIDDPQCTAEDVAYLLERDQPRRARAARPRPTCSAPGPGCARS